MTIDPSRCPLCGQANDCQLAAGHAKCWCFDTPVPNAILERIPIEARSVVCVCRSCADGTTDENQRRHLALRWTRR